MDKSPNNKPIDFQIMRINKNARKICRCNPPSYEIDVTNRLVQCIKCNAYIQPFDALLQISENWESYGEKINQLKEEMNRMIDKRNNFAREVNSLSTKRFRINKFRDLQSSYLKGLMPHCPHCEKPFDPTEITNHTNKNYCNYKKKKSRKEKIYKIALHKAGNGLERWDKIDSLQKELESYTDEELDKELEEINKWIGE